MDTSFPPKLLAFVVCDLVYTEKSTGKTSLLGIFSRLKAKTFPVQHDRFCVHVALCNGRGSPMAKLQLVQCADEEKSFFEAEGTITFPDPLSVVEINFEILNLSLPSPGHYEFRFFCHEELIAQRPFHASVVSSD